MKDQIVLPGASAWSTMPLGDLCKMYQPKTITKKEMNPAGAYPVFGANGIIGRYDQFNHEEPQLVVGCRGACGSVHMTEPFSWITGNTMVIQPKSSVVDLRFLEYFFRGPADVASAVTGAAQPQITQTSLSPIPVPLPPLEEQKRIVEVLDQAFAALDRARAHAEANLADLKDLAEMQLDLAVSGIFCGSEADNQTVEWLLEEISAKRKQVKNAKEYSLPDEFSGGAPLREGWQWVPLGNLASRISDGVHKTPKYVETGIPFITVKNLTAGPGISFAETKFITREDHEDFIKRTHPEKGDILISKDGTIGVIRKITTDREFSIFVSVALVKPLDQRLGDYLTIALQAPSVQERIVPKGAALKHLYLGDLRRLPIPLGPLDDLRKTVGRMAEVSSALDRLGQIFEAKIRDHDALRQSLLQKAFSGQLTA